MTAFFTGDVAETWPASKATTPAAMVFVGPTEGSGLGLIAWDATATPGDGALIGTPGKATIFRRTWSGRQSAPVQDRSVLDVDLSGGHVGVHGEVTTHDGLRIGAEGSPVQRLVRGEVNADGSVASGTGFTVTHSTLGVYLITLATAMPTRPTVHTSVEWDGTSDSEWSVSTMVAKDNTRVRVVASQVTPTPGRANTAFAFTLIG